VIKQKEAHIKPAKRIYLILLVLLIVLVVACVVLYAIQDGMIFYHVMDSESRNFLTDRPGFREVQFTAENGKTYHGMMYQASGELAPLVIYFGGNGEVSYRNLRNHEEQGQWRYFPGYHYLFVDYEGYGINNGKTNYLNMYEHALAVYDYAAALPGVDNKHIVAMGYSLGTGSAVHLAANRTVAGLILATPYANGYDLYNNLIPIFYGPMRLLVKQKLPSDKYAPNVTCPVLIIASRADEMIPLSSSERLSERFSGDVEFMTLNDAVHNKIFQAAGVFDKVQFFLGKVAPK
jgi:pimeloyl-ACP methyl ester carboxylesterase